MKTIVSLIVLLNTVLFALSGEEVFSKKCASCHESYIPQVKIISNAEHNNSELHLKAPTLTEMSFMIKDQIGDRKTDAEGQTFQIEEWLTQYLDDPDSVKKSVPKKFTHFFKPMPSMKGQVSEEEIEALSDYIYEYSKKMMLAHGVKRHSMEEALQIAKKEGKIVLIEGYIPFCRWCMKMDREVMVNEKVKDVLEKDFVFAKANLLIEELPLGMKRLGTPSFYFIGSDGKTILDRVEGFGTVDEFIALLNGIKQKAKE